MSALPIIVASVGFAIMLAAIVAKALVVDEIKGRIQRAITARLEATIATLPDELQAEWAEEWRAELATIIGMPLTAAQFVAGVRRSACELAAEPALAPAGASNPGSAPSSRRAPSRMAHMLDQAFGWLRSITTTLVHHRVLVADTFAP